MDATISTISRALQWGKGYAGKLGKRCWVARISGTDPQYGLARDFLAAETVEREHFTRARTIINFTYALPVGLYEMCAKSERWYLIVWEQDGALKAFRPDDERVAAIAALMHDGIEFDAARRATKRATKRAQEIANGQTA